jgi:PleD family two-component response regulator
LQQEETSHRYRRTPDFSTILNVSPREYQGSRSPWSTFLTSLQRLTSARNPENGTGSYWRRDLVLTLARQDGGLLRELAKRAGGIDYVSVSVALRRLQQRLKQDRELARLYQKAQTRLNNEKI